MISNVKMGEGHTLTFRATVDGKTVTATYPRAFVENEINETASREDCQEYLDTRAAIIIAAVRSRMRGEYGTPPFNAVRLKG